MVLQVSDLSSKLASRDTEFDAYRRQVLSKPESKLQAELTMIHMEKVCVNYYPLLSSCYMKFSNVYTCMSGCYVYIHVYIYTCTWRMTVDHIWGEFPSK